MATTPHRRDLPAPAVEPDTHPIISTAAGRALAVLRIAFGLTFLWAFFDKLFGLGLRDQVRPGLGRRGRCDGWVPEGCERPDG